MTNQEIQKLACKVSEQSEWDGLEICLVTMYALEDANFSDLGKELMPIINAYFKKHFEMDNAVPLDFI